MNWNDWLINFWLTQIVKYLVILFLFMIRLITKKIQLFSSRKQNFFELNPVYPDYGEKDFDIYNV